MSYEAAVYFHFPGLSLALLRLDKRFSVTRQKHSAHHTQTPTSFPHALRVRCGGHAACQAAGKAREVRRGVYTKSHSALHNKTSS